MIRLKFLTALAITGTLSACATLPSSGPTGSQVIDRVETSAGEIQLVSVTDMASLPAPTAPPRMTLAELPPPPTDMVGPGDVLEISIYEAGVSLFGNEGRVAPSAAFDPSAKAHTLPLSRVDDDGNIVIPFVGSLRVLGRTVSEIQDQIQRALRGLTQNPQVLVTRRNVITNSIIVSGEVAQPGRLVLETNRETLSDVIALSGGYRGTASELEVRVTRGDRTVELRMSDLIDDPLLDVRAYPGDRVALIMQPRTFSILGAAGRIDQVAFRTPAVSLAEAVATAGGANPNLGDAAAIFVFRYVPDADRTMRPTVYHVNMMQAESYLLTQRFAMQDHDVLYVANARANQPSKLIQLISQLFSPILTVTSTVAVVQNSN